MWSTRRDAAESAFAQGGQVSSGSYLPLDHFAMGPRIEITPEVVLSGEGLLLLGYPKHVIWLTAME